MIKNFAIAAATVAGIGYAVANLTDHGLKACGVDGDGRVFLLKSDGSLGIGRGWSLSADGKTCASGMTDPIILPRRDLVNHVGQPLPKP